MRYFVTALAFFCLSFAATIVWSHPQIPGGPQQAPIAIVGATIHIVSGDAIPVGTIIFDKGRITAVGENVAIPENAIRLDGTGKHVYPGLFDAYSNLGLLEIDAVRATLDRRETGSMNPNIKAQIAVNPDSELIPVARSNGVLFTQTAPVGGLISGRGAVIQLDGWTFEDMTLQGDAGLHIQWPRITWPQEDDHGHDHGDDEEDKDDDESDPVKPLDEYFRMAKSYAAARDDSSAKQGLDIRLESMLPVLERQIPVIAHANRLAQIRSAVAFGLRHKVRVIIYGGYDAPRCSDLLNQHKIPVIVGAVYRLPLRHDDPYDASFTLPNRLRESGITYCISGEGRFAASNVRNLPYHASMAASFGLPKPEALRAITLYPARIFGVAKQIGSLQIGKHASLFIANGDILETPTQVEAAFLQGRKVDLNDRHKTLYNKYRQRYEQLQGK